MFGYILPLREELKVKDWERFRAVYCGLCRTMGQRCGQLSRLLLSYDFTFLALLLGADGGEECCRCPGAPCRGRRCLGQDKALELAADESMILAWWKLQDQLRDEPALSPKGVAARVLSVVYRRAYHRAAARQPGFDQLTEQQLQRLHELEAERCPSIDRPADAFARILTGVVPKTGDELHDRGMEQLLYHVGRWIYLIDAWDDMAEDLKNGAYNPLVLRYALEEVPEPEGPEERALELTLTHSNNLALSAFRLLDETRNNPIIENILWGGLPMVRKLVLAGEWRNQKKLLREKPK